MDQKTYSDKAKAQAQNFWYEARLCLRRVVRSDFQRERATDKEREQLATCPEAITNPMVQDYVAWRRSLLWVAAVLIGLYAVLSLDSFTTFEAQVVAGSGQTYEMYRAEHQRLPEWQRNMAPMQSREAWEAERFEAVREMFGGGNADLITGIGVITLLSVIVSAILLAIAAQQWKSVQKSRRWSRAAWLVMFGVPFLISFLPITAMMDFDEINPQLGDAEQLKTLMGATFAIGVFMTIAPKAIALFPGIIRSCISLKTLVPESATPGWIAAAMAPLYAIFLLTLVSVMNQVQGDILLVGGVICYIVAPLIYVWKADQVVRPHTPEEITTVLHGVRQLASIFTIVGSVLLAAFIFRMPNMDFENAMSFLMGVAGNVLLMTVVAADLVVALLYQGYRQSREFAGTELEASLDVKYQALSEVGFTHLRTGAGLKSGSAVLPAAPDAQDASGSGETKA